MWGKFWSDRMREQRTHLFWTLLDCQPKEEEEEVGRGRPGRLCLYSRDFRAGHAPGSPGSVYSSSSAHVPDQGPGSPRVGS